MKTWYSIQALSGASPEIAIFEEIGAFGVSAKTFIASLRELDAQEITLSINSPGGSVFDALAIHNALKQHPAQITARIMGVAASAASLVAMAGDCIVMPDNSFMMVHNPLAGTIGNADDHREMADVLDKIGNSLVGIYVQRTGQPEDKVRALLDAETWMNAQDALALGFADEIEAAAKMAARFDLDRLPQAIRSAMQPPAPTPEAAPPSVFSDITALAEQFGLSDFTRVFLLDQSIATPEQARAAITEARDIHELCTFAGAADQASGFIHARKSLAEVRVTLINARADAADAQPTNGHIPTSSDSGLASQVWSARNGKR